MFPAVFYGSPTSENTVAATKFAFQEVVMLHKKFKNILILHLKHCFLDKACASKMKKLFTIARKAWMFSFSIFAVISTACYFLLLLDVNVWIDKECSECVISHLNIYNQFTDSHPLKGENCRSWRKNSKDRKIHQASWKLIVKIFLSTGLMQVLLTTCSKSANIKLQQVWFSDLMQSVADTS